jgi:hypothetical protein
MVYKWAQPLSLRDGARMGTCSSERFGFAKNFLCRVRHSKMQPKHSSWCRAVLKSWNSPVVFSMVSTEGWRTSVAFLKYLEWGCTGAISSCIVPATEYLPPVKIPLDRFFIWPLTVSKAST